MNERPDVNEPLSAFEDQLARCIEARSGGDPQRLEGLLTEQPGLAVRLRARLAELETLGLIDALETEPREVSRHRLLARLGRGGMGTVYLAEELDGGKRVALKLANQYLDDGEAGQRVRARFQREVHAVAQLDHPNIVSIRASGEHGGRPWFSMEHVRGALLSRVIERLRAGGTAPDLMTAQDVRRAVDVELTAAVAVADPDACDELAPADSAAWSGSYIDWCCRVASNVASALEHAHLLGVVHRDVKASNVLIRPDGHTLLFDFGLAHVHDQSTLTRSGDFAGTPYAVAPEQADSSRGPIDARTDVWGVGVLLYELLALRRPFDGAGPADLLQRVLNHDPLPLRRLHPGLPRAVENICATALEKRPDRRFRSARALLDDLERLRVGRPVLARGASRRRRAARFVARRPAASIGIAFLTLTAIGIPGGLLTANAIVREHARRAEEAARESARLAQANAEVVDYLVDLFEPVDARTEWVDASTLALLEAQAQRLEVWQDERELARAALLEATGTIFANLGRPERARPLFDRAFAMRQAEGGERDPGTITVLAKLADVLVEVGDAEAALGLCRRGLSALEDLADPPPPSLRTDFEVTHARAQFVAGRADQAARELARVLERSTDPATRADVLEELARVDAGRGHPNDARSHALASLRARRAVWLPDSRALARGLDLLGELEERLGHAQAARAAGDEAVALRLALSPTPSSPLPALLELHDPSSATFEQNFQAGITALQARQLAEAEQHFEDALRVRPGDTVCMYNLACCRTVAGDIEGALGWVERAVEKSRGADGDRLRLLRSDADLSALHDDPRFDALMQRLGRDGERLAAFVTSPAVHRPATPTTEPTPLLVVLHRDGSNKGEVTAGPWAQVADQLGWTLVALSAPRPLGPEASAGAAWIDDIGEFARQPWRDEVTCAQTLRTFLGSNDVDRERVFVAGEGSGALIAFDLALRAPGLVRGVLLVQGPAFVEIPESRARTAAALGLRVAVILARDEPITWIRPEASAEPYGRALSAWMAERGLGGALDFISADPNERIRACVNALRALTPDS